MKEEAFKQFMAFFTLLSIVMFINLILTYIIKEEQKSNKIENLEKEFELRMKYDFYESSKKTDSIYNVLDSIYKSNQ